MTETRAGNSVAPCAARIRRHDRLLSRCHRLRCSGLAFCVVLACIASRCRQSACRAGWCRMPAMRRAGSLLQLGIGHLLAQPLRSSVRASATPTPGLGSRRLVVVAGDERVELTQEFICGRAPPHVRSCVTSSYRMSHGLSLIEGFFLGFARDVRHDGRDAYGTARRLNSGASSSCFSDACSCWLLIASAILRTSSVLHRPTASLRARRRGRRGTMTRPRKPGGAGRH